ncbi:EF-hand calcium-binding domain-containing protein 6 isoform X2 [Mixophyes fleayi]|uniref:EF-hand calcium-binding domain-containing protein 6 isoform X2 n=1 Tax=Mixophyes fleayi TaxID=3061075 RepID=UPI003F4DB629
MHSKRMNPGSLADLRPITRGISFPGRPLSSPCRTVSRGSNSSSLRSSLRSSVISVPDPNLSIQNIEQILYQRVDEIEEHLKNAFFTLDVDHTFTVTKGQLYRVLKNFVITLTQPQFDELVSKIPVLCNGTIPYLDFLAQFRRVGTSAAQVKRRWSCSQANQVMTLNELESRLKEMICKNLKNIVRSCRLFDYNQNGQIQKHELRRVLENYCFKMKNVEYEKLWNHYCIGKKHTLDYKELLRNLGATEEHQSKRLQESVAQALNWEAASLEKRNGRRPSHDGFNAEDYTLEELEVLFRKKISSTHPDLVKAFRSFDIDQTGCVSLDALQSVINNFIFQLPDQTFHQLMSRFRFKAAETISWEQFLKKFPGPNYIENGQTLPIKSNHRSNPVIERQAHFSNDHILQKLQQHFQEAYPSLKQAFLILDEGRHGRVSRTELRRIVDCMMFRITDEQFKELMIILDPEHTGFISYHQFLDLFEEKESVTGHKWLNNTRQQAKETSIVMSLDTVESILCDKISRQWKDFAKAVQSLDTKGSGIINKDQFKRLLQSYCSSMLDDHFEMICDQYGCGSSDGVSYMEFLCNLGVSLCHADDVNGVSTVILDRNHFQEELRQTDHSDRMREIENQASNFIKKIAAEEVIDRLKDCVTKHSVTVKESFLACSRKPNGKVSRKDFRKVLQDHQLHLNDDQFNDLTDKLGFTKEGLSYLDFVSLFEAPSGDGPGDKLHNSPNHRVNNTKTHYMTAEECLTQLPDKLKEGYGDTYAAFYKIDSNHDGIITMHDFRHLLDSFMFFITQKEYERLLSLLGLNLTSTLNYTDFLNLVRRQEKEDCPPWLNSSYRPKQSQDSADLACEQAHYYLLTKAQGRWQDLAKTFCEMDSDGNGIIQKKDLRNVLYRFSLPITSHEFEKLWIRYDPEGKGHLTHQEFLQKLGVNFASGDSGPSKRIIEDNRQTLEKHHSTQQKIHQEMQVFHMHQTRALDIKDIEQQVKDKFREYYPDFGAAFAKMDKNKDGLITIQDFREMLERLNFYLDDDQFFNLLYRLRIRVRDNKLSYFDFLKMIDDGRASKYGQRREQIVPAESLQAISSHKAFVQLKEAVKTSHEELYKSDVTWAERVDRATRKRSGQEITMRDILTHIQEVVSARSLSIAQDFLNIDYAGINVISKEDFRHIFNRNFMLLTDDQFENLWNILPLNSYGNLLYHDFLKKFSCEMPTTPLRDLSSRSSESSYKSESLVTQGRTSAVTRRPKTAPPILRQPTTPVQRPRTAAPRTAAPRTAAPRYAPIMNCEQVENRFKSNLGKRWQDVYKAFREKDPKKQGEMTSSDFSAVMRTFNMDISEEELEQLTLKYDMRHNGKFSYPDFLRNVTLGPNTLLQRMKLQKPRLPGSTELHKPWFMDIMLRTQPQIVTCWKPMRRVFQSYDEARTGYISIQDFKQVLRRFGINLSEDEFFHVLSYFDENLTSRIPYNDFLRQFLR